MEIPKTESPPERRINEWKENDQLEQIILNNNKWLEFLFHEFNGLLGNINWITRLMENKPEQDDLPSNTFAELNLTTQQNIYTLKVIQQYTQVLNEIAQFNRFNADEVLLGESTILNYIPQMKPFQVELIGLPIEVSSAFAKVLAFLLSKVLEVMATQKMAAPFLSVHFDASDYRTLRVYISGTGIDWDASGWNNPQAGFSPALQRGDANEWARQMFFEVLQVTGGKLLSGCNGNTHEGITGKAFRPENEPGQRQSELQYVAFCVPYGLERDLK